MSFLRHTVGLLYNTHILCVRLFVSLSEQWMWTTRKCVYLVMLVWPCCFHDLDLDPMTVMHKSNLDIMETYLHAKNEVSTSRLSKVRARTRLSWQTHRRTDRRDRTHYCIAFAGGVFIERHVAETYRPQSTAERRLSWRSRRSYVVDTRYPTRRSRPYPGHHRRPRERAMRRPLRPYRWVVGAAARHRTASAEWYTWPPGRDIQQPQQPRMTQEWRHHALARDHIVAAAFCSSAHVPGPPVHRIQHPLCLRMQVQYIYRVYLLSARKFIRLWWFTRLVHVKFTRLYILKHKLDSLCWFSQRRSRTPHFGGEQPQGYSPQIRTRPIFLYNAPTPYVSSSYVYLFGHYRVDKLTHKLTNKQTDAAENIQRYDVE